MAVNLSVPSAAELFSVRGVRLGIGAAAIKYPNRDDLTVILLDEGTIAAGVFTQNRYCAAPVTACRQHLTLSPKIRALLVNTGCANAGTGDLGWKNTVRSCEELASRLGIKASEVLPFSTGVIMEQLPIDKLIKGLDAAILDANDGNWLRAAKAIMTTDTLPKVRSCQLTIKGEAVTISGVCKGAGMIHPNMATMLGFIATDASINPKLLSGLAKEVADASFNCVTVDGDTSTNDSFVLLATQKTTFQIDNWVDEDAKKFKSQLIEMAQFLAKSIARDGEGATKFITVKVEEGKSRSECLQVAFAVANSSLIKTAFFASDPNLGRILCAIGYSEVADLDPTKIELYLGDVHVVSKGGRLANYQEEKAQAVMKHSEIVIRILLGRGSEAGQVWTCDLSHDYVTINADYRS